MIRFKYSTNTQTHSYSVVRVNVNYFDFSVSILYFFVILGFIICLQAYFNFYCDLHAGDVSSTGVLCF